MTDAGGEVALLDVGLQVRALARAKGVDEVLVGCFAFRAREVVEGFAVVVVDDAGVGVAVLADDEVALADGSAIGFCACGSGSGETEGFSRGSLAGEFIHGLGAGLGRKTTGFVDERDAVVVVNSEKSIGGLT